MNKHEIFHAVKAHLLKQNMRSFIGCDCQYRGPDGLKCAVGALIKDEHYDPEFEGSGVLSLAVLTALQKSGVLEPEYDIRRELSWPTPEKDERIALLCDLQDIHDVHEPPRWPGLLEEIANRYAIEALPA